MKKVVLLISVLFIICAATIYVIQYKMPYKKQAFFIPNNDKQITRLEEKETWQKVKKHLYFNKNSLDIQYDNYIRGVFKEYLYGEDRRIDNQSIAYQIIETAAFCDIELQGGIKKIEYPIFRFYDENNNFISEYNIHKIWEEKFPDGHLGITHPEDEKNGDVYFDILCSYAK